MIRQVRRYWRDIKTRQAKQFMAAALRACKVGFRAVKRHSQTIEIAAVAVGVVVLGGSLFWQHLHRFDTTQQALNLLPKTSVQQKLITSKDGKVSYTAATDASVRNKLVVADPTNATNGQNLYEASFGLDSGKGLTFSQATPASSQSSPSIPHVPGLPSGAGQPDQNAKLSFTITPMGGGVQQGRQTNGRVQYPSAGGQRFYTFRKNGVAEDILLTKAPGDTAQYQWKLNLPSSLEARMLPSGAVGIYSANPDLFGNIQVGDTKSQQLLDKARKNGAKDTLAFVLPAPVIKTANGTTDYSHTKFSLSHNILTLTANSLRHFSYPLSIDPQVVVSSTNEFRLGYDDGMIDYTTTADQITRANISGGAVGTWNYTYNGNSCATFSASPCSSGGFTAARDGHTSVVYNGFLYVMGGYDGTSYHNDVQYALICTGSNNGVGGCSSTAGTLGTWNYTYNGNSCATNASPCNGGFTTARSSHASVVYNGFLYIIGGFHSTSDTACNVASSFYCNDVQYALICTGSNNGVGGCSSTAGTLGTWNYTYNGNSCATFSASPCSSNGFTNARYGHASVVYNGFLYILGGGHVNADTTCSSPSSQYCADVQYAPLNADGTVGTWKYTYNGNSCATFSASPCSSGGFTTARYGNTTIAYNGFLYVIGGYHGSNDTACNGTTSQYCADVQYAPLNADGTVGTWKYTYNGNSCATFSASPCSSGGFTTARDFHTSVASNGYLYIIGGYDGTNYHNDVEQAAINANGAIGAWNTTTSFTTVRESPTTVVYNGYLYIVGGKKATSDTACSSIASIFCSDVQYAQIQPMGTAGPTTQQTSAFTTARASQTSVVYNGYLYIVGGCSAFSAGCSTAQADVQYCPLNASTGAVGACTTQASAFTTARYSHTSVVYNGYIYIVGGAAVGGASQNDILYSWISSTGALCLPSNHATCSGTVFTQQTSAFTTARQAHASVAYNGYLYIIGGFTPAMSDVQYCPLNASTGAVGTCTQQANALSIANYRQAAVVYNGYIYLTGGSNTGISIQYAWISSSGALCLPSNHSTCTGNVFTQTNTFTTAREGHTSVVYNGYLYIVGGNNVSSFNDIQQCPFNNDGSVGNCTQQTSAFTTARWGHTSVVYNGYLYIVGGCTQGGAYPCNSGFQNDVQRLWLGQMGQVGANVTNGTGIITNREAHSSVVYNGYMYIIGGATNASASGCTTSGSSAWYCNDVQRCPLNNDGSVGSCTQQTSAFTTARNSQASVVYNGYLYIAGGFDGTSTKLNDIQYAWLDPSTGAACLPSSHATCTGTVFTQQTSAFTTGRAGLTSVIHNGYLYVIGGFNGSEHNDIQYAQINSDGSLCTPDGTFSSCPGSGNSTPFFTQQTSAFTTGRDSHTSVVYNGYLYIIGGFGTASSSGCNASNLCGDIQYLPFCTAASTPSGCPSTNWQGAVGSTTQELNAFTSPRYGQASIVYNGFLYIIGGYTGSDTNDIQYCPISSAGWVGTCSMLTSAFTTGREYPTSVVNNGYLYIAGGQSGASYDGDIQYLPLSSTDFTAPYERTVDVGNANATIQSVVYNGTATCGVQIQYATAGSSGAFGSVTTLQNITPGTTNTISNGSNQEYVWMRLVMDDSTCGGQSDITDITVNYSVPPSSPTLITPAASATGLNSLTPDFTLSSSDPSSDNLQYMVQVCNNADCSSVRQTACQATSTTPACTGSQTSWFLQDRDSGTTYASSTSQPSSTVAKYTYNGSALSWGATYYWRAWAYDPTYTSWSLSPSGIQPFTTNFLPSAPTLTKPTASAIGVSTLPELRFFSTDADSSDYLQYWVDICSTSNCSSIVRSICQINTGSSVPGTCSSPSQTGWTGQNQQSSTAYSAGQTAIHTYQPTALTANTQYWWRAYAIDPGGSNTWSSASSIGTFTTQTSATPPTVRIGGSNVNIGGNVIIKP
ncbi:MAG TPA: hypothetical protein VLG13_00140 [Patescibacteria group bacterium]|nr:hypothetical protein [Patescibacteria group bacterium]